MPDARSPAAGTKPWLCRDAAVARRPAPFSRHLRCSTMSFTPPSGACRHHYRPMSAPRRRRHSTSLTTTPQTTTAHSVKHAIAQLNAVCQQRPASRKHIRFDRARYSREQERSREGTGNMEERKKALYKNRRCQLICHADASPQRYAMPPAGVRERHRCSPSPYPREHLIQRRAARRGRAADARPAAAAAAVSAAVHAHAALRVILPAPCSRTFMRTHHPRN